MFLLFTVIIYLGLKSCLDVIAGDTKRILHMLHSQKLKAVLAK